MFVYFDGINYFLWLRSIRIPFFPSICVVYIFILFIRLTVRFMMITSFPHIDFIQLNSLFVSIERTKCRSINLNSKKNCVWFAPNIISIIIRRKNEQRGEGTLLAVTFYICRFYKMDFFLQHFELKFNWLVNKVRRSRTKKNDVRETCLLPHF